MGPFRVIMGHIQNEISKSDFGTHFEPRTSPTRTFTNTRAKPMVAGSFLQLFHHNGHSITSQTAKNTSSEFGALLNFGFDQSTRNSCCSLARDAIVIVIMDMKCLHFNKYLETRTHEFNLALVIAKLRVDEVWRPKWVPKSGFETSFCIQYAP